jgi:hypothetical protein
MDSATVKSWFKNLPGWVTIPLFTFGGAAVGYAETAITNGIPTTTAGWKVIASGALTAGVSAVAHYWLNNRETKDLKQKMSRMQSSEADTLPPVLKS